MKKIDKKQAAARIEELYRGGWTMQRIADSIGVSRQRVHQLMADLQICKKSRVAWRDSKPKGKKVIAKKERKSRLGGDVDEARVFAYSIGLSDPYKRFKANIKSAKGRGILWGMTFQEWWGLWKQFYHLRGTKMGCMNLCRTADEGAYVVGNVRIDTVKSNHHERVLEHRCKKRPKRIKVTGVAWTDASQYHQIDGYYPQGDDSLSN